MRRSLRLTREGDRSVDRSDPRAPLSDVEVDQNSKSASRLLRRARKRMDIAGIVDDDHQTVGLSLKGDEAIDHRVRHHR
jgi:hypothetical protein